jgi:ABC-type lipoprotein release transport system permease subunit
MAKQKYRIENWSEYNNALYRLFKLYNNILNLLIGYAARLF